MAQRHLRDDLFEAFPMLGGGGGDAQVGIDDHHIVRTPAETDGALLERVLEPEALLVGQGLLRRRLAHIDQRFAGPVLGRDEFGRSHGSPRGRSPRGRRRSGVAERAGGAPRGRWVGKAWAVALLGHGTQVGDRVARQLGGAAWPRCRQISSWEWKAQGHLALVGDKGVRHALNRRADRAQRETASKQGMGRIGDLDLGYCAIGWVIE